VILVVAMAILGSISGFAGGLSRVGVVGDIIPAALALTGGVSAYLFGVDRSKGVIASLCAAAFALSLGFGYSSGASIRGGSERQTAIVQECKTAMLQPEILGDDRAFCRFVTMMGDQCFYHLASDLSRIPVVNGSKEMEQLNFQNLLLKFHTNAQYRLDAIPKCQKWKSEFIKTPNPDSADT